ncbi:unnamed protein product [Caenorhabditis angaria]|uniref:Uncharacterized protein n=1 Tax=Caenorhabditis angaria TaxID=860376 RepID=A0A9P1J648_9PELO|nr:unnamed protein product [Caenorhabditis angaria]
MDTKTEYAKTQEDKHRRKIILPNNISWEYGTNKYATQKGDRHFGTIRNTQLEIKSSKQLSESNDGAVPHITCPPLHFPCASQSKTSGFGSIREQVTKVTDTNGDEKVLISKIVDDKMTETVLKKWNQPNHNAKNSDIGKRRDALTETIGGKRMDHKEHLKCMAAIPRFQDPRNSMAALGMTPGQNYQPGCQKNRQATTLIEGLNWTTSDQLDSNKYMAWLGGQLTLQSQSKTGGFMKTRDVVSQDYYGKIDHLENAKELREKLEKVRLEKKQEEEEDEDKIEEEEEDINNIIVYS